MKTEQNQFKSGFVALAGAPNVGKSTLLNRLLGEKISITSPKPQTTRNRILGILHQPDTQIIFIDTPGVHKARSPLNVRIVDTALLSFGEADLMLVVVDADNSDPTSERILIENISRLKKPAVLALNKIDLVDHGTILKLIDTWSKAYPFEAVIPVSAQKGTQTDQLVHVMQTLLPPGPPYFPEDSLTDLPERFIAAEMIREKVFRLTGQEIPYATAVTVDRFREEKQGRLIKIDATIHVERDSQKGIIIGRQGAKLKRIGEEARKEIEKMIAVQVYLKLFVRVQKNWSRDTRALRRFGY